MHAVAAQEKTVMDPRFLHRVVDPDRGRGSDGAGEDVAATTPARRMIVGQASQTVIAQPIEPCIPKMDIVSLPATQNQRGEGASQPLQGLVGPPDRVKPVIDSFERSRAGLTDGARLRAAQIGVDEVADT